MKKYDLIVIGGGFSGVAAALAAARNGIKVLIVEKSNSLGGAATNCLVNPFMGTQTKIDGKLVSLCRGIYSEILDKLKEYNAISGTTFKEEELKLILNRMVLEAGIDLLFHARLYDVVTDGAIIRSVKLACISGTLELNADCFIDASGDAELAYYCGCPYQLGRETDNLCQPMTLCFRVSNVDKDKFFSDYKRINELYKSYKIQGKIQNPREDILAFGMPISGVLHFNATRIIKRNPVDPFDVTQAELEAREQVFEMFNFLRDNADGFENASLIMTAAQTGTRESRMIDGEYRLTVDDILSCTKFPDSIAAGNYDIDIHNPEGSGTSHHYFKEGEYYTIPYRTLLPKTIDNLIVAGRCISSDHQAQASYRIMPIVCCIGEAAGYASTLAVKGDKNYKNVNIKKLQTLLKNNNAFI